jgi:hypothetical protein
MARAAAANGLVLDRSWLATGHGQNNPAREFALATGFLVRSRL